MKYAILAYLTWGLLPIYWKVLSRVPALEIICHRVGWSLIFYTAYLYWHRAPLMSAFRQPRRVWLNTMATAVLLFANWYLYIWGVNSGRIIELSLGYFINPLVNVALGVVVLRERLNLARWLALALVTIGVAWLSAHSDGPPWLALGLAFTFGIYGFLKKITPVDGAQGAQLEALFMAPLAIVAVALNTTPFQAPNYTSTEWILLLGTGALTGLPLIWFAVAAQLIPLNLLGFTQYISPTLQFLLGYLLYSEPFYAWQLIGFGLIWVALLIFAVDLWRTEKTLKNVQ